MKMASVFWARIGNIESSDGSWSANRCRIGCYKQSATKQEQLCKQHCSEIQTNVQESPQWLSIL